MALRVLQRETGRTLYARETHKQEDHTRMRSVDLTPAIAPDTVKRRCE